MASQAARSALGRLMAPGQLARSVSHPRLYDVCFLLEEKRLYPHLASLLPAPPSRAVALRPPEQRTLPGRLCSPLQVLPRRRDLAGSPDRGASRFAPRLLLELMPAASRAPLPALACKYLAFRHHPASSERRFRLSGTSVLAGRRDVALWVRAVVLLCGARGPRHAGLLFERRLRARSIKDRLPEITSGCDNGARCCEITKAFRAGNARC